MKRVFALLMIACLLTAGCTARQPGPEQDLTGDLTPAVLSEAVCDDYSAMTAFAASLFSHTLKNGEANPVVSPASAYLCLAMVQNGADTDTLTQFAQVLGADTETLNRMCRAFVAHLSDTKNDTVLSVADAIFADDDRAHLTDSYLQALVDHFGAEAYTVDLPSDAALDAVNGWVSEKTRGLIPTLHEDNYPEDTVLVLLNTLYFKALWQNRFEGYQTRDKDFSVAADKTARVPFLCAYEEQVSYFNDGTAEGAVLPYNDGKTAFVALRPSGGGSARALARTLTDQTFAACLAGAKDTLVNLSMPKFTVEYGMNMTDILNNMGLTLAFDADRADLTRMGTGKDGPLYLSRVIQKVKIIVDEEGTEAAAVTEAAAATGAMPPAGSPVELHFDQPFVYAVVDLETGVPLFLGMMDDPAAAPGTALPQPAADAEPPVLDAALYQLLSDAHTGYFPALIAGLG